MSLTIPNSERRTAYTPVVSTTNFAVGFAIADGDDVEVWHDGEIVATADYGVSLGPLAAGFYSSATVVLDTGVTGDVEIVGKRAPRRTGSLVDGAGYPASDINADQNLLYAQVRELYDKLGRAVVTVPGADTLLPLPTPEAGKLLAWNADEDGFENVEPAGAQGPAGTFAVGTVTTLAPGAPATVVNVGTPGAAIVNFGIPAGSTGASGAGSGNVVGPASASNGHAALFDGGSPTLLKTAGFAPANVVHTHAQSDITNLVSDLAAKLATSAVGVTVQAYSAFLTALAALSGTAADFLFYTTGGGGLGVSSLTALGRTLLGRATAALMRSDLSAAAKSQTLEGLPFIIKTPANETWEEYYRYMPHGGTLTALRYTLGAGSLTFQLRKNGSNWGSSYAVDGDLDEAMGLSLTWDAGDRIGYTISAISSASQFSAMGTYTRALE